MNWTSLDPIGLTFGLFNILRLASYFPQIVAVARDQNGASAISFSCWLIWAGANASTAVYAWVRVGDNALALISAFNAGCCLMVLLLAAFKRSSVSIRAPVSGHPRSQNASMKRGAS